MPLDYAGSAALMKDQAFIDRVKVACLKFADYIMGEAQSTPAHSTRMRWAQRAFEAPDATAVQVTPPTVMDSAVQGAGGEITDAALQSAVEGVVNKML